MRIVDFAAYRTLSAFAAYTALSIRAPSGAPPKKSGKPPNARQEVQEADQIQSGT
jgi:hypothetical protein